MQTISLRLPDDLVEELNQTAKARRVAKSRIVRESLEQALQPKQRKAPSCYDVADLRTRPHGGGVYPPPRGEKRGRIVHTARTRDHSRCP